MCSKLDKVMAEYETIIDYDLLEDRREYSKEDLQVANPEMDSEQIDYLYRMIQSNFPTDPSETLYRSNWKAEDALKLAENISEAIHQEFDGWTEGEKVIIHLFLKDLEVAQAIA